MEWIISVIAAIASVVAAYYAVRNDKAHIKKRIRNKKHKISDLKFQKETKYRDKMIFGAVTPEDAKIKKLEREISELEDRL